MAVVGAFVWDPQTGDVIEAGEPSGTGLQDVWAQFKTAINTIDLAQMNTNSVGNVQIVALAITRAKCALDVID